MKILEVEYDINICRAGRVSLEIKEGDDVEKAIRQAVWDDLRERMSREIEPDDGDEIDHDITDEYDISEDEVDSASK